MTDKILGLIAANGLSQDAFEKAIRLPQGRFSKWKDGKGEPKASQLLAMSRHLGVSADWLIDPEAADPDTERARRERDVWRIVREVGFDEAWRRLVIGSGKGRPVIDLVVEEVPGGFRVIAGAGPIEVFPVLPSIHLALGRALRDLVSSDQDPAVGAADDEALGRLLKEEAFRGRFGIGEVRVITDKPEAGEPPFRVLYGRGS